jgi:hypothetical protein
MPHVAFKTDNIDEVLIGKDIIMPLYEPFKGYRCAMIWLCNMPIELLETTLTEHELWNNQDVLKNGILYK